MIEKINKKFVSKSNFRTKTNFSSVNVDGKQSDENQISVSNRCSGGNDLTNHLSENIISGYQN